MAYSIEKKSHRRLVRWAWIVLVLATLVAVPFIFWTMYHDQHKDVYTSASLIALIFVFLVRTPPPSAHPLRPAQWPAVRGSKRC